VVGIGRAATLALRREIPGVREFPCHVEAGFEVSSTPAALWCWLRGTDRGERVHRTRNLEAVVADTFALTSIINGFQHGEGRDRTGQEDGTESPRDASAVAAAVVPRQVPWLAGSSCVVVQRWVLDFRRFEAMTGAGQDGSIGRRLADHTEIADAPPSAHVQRVVQESFDPEAFFLRRSMPWVERDRAGLVCVPLGPSFEAFEVQLRRTVGAPPYRGTIPVGDAPDLT
jgi:putative iron-dependent peroxidase